MPQVSLVFGTAVWLHARLITCVISVFGVRAIADFGPPSRTNMRDSVSI